VNSMKDSILGPVLASRTFDLTKSEDKQHLAYYLLVELLAFQFASPVRWIETQDYFFKNGVEMIVEVGPATTLKGMAQRTLQLAGAKYGFFPAKDMLSFKQDKEMIYYEQVPQPIKPKRTLKQKKTTEPAPAPEVKRVEVVLAEVKADPSPAAPIVKVVAVSKAYPTTVSAYETLQVLLAVKLKKNLNEVTSESTIKELVGGKSAIQNEILGDLQKEFGTEPEGAATVPITQLASLMGATYVKLGS